MKCTIWLEEYIKTKGPVEPKTVYRAGVEHGFDRKEIKAARKWHGKYIESQITGERTLWRWDK